MRNHRICLPNAVIAGAPKCGTSTLFQWMVDHPEVCGSSVKETFYLMDKEHPLLQPLANYHSHGIEGYYRFFEHCRVRKDIKILLEATTHYMYQNTALQILSRLMPVPHVIFLLRRPSERIYSSYRYTQNNLCNLDKGISFRQFVEAIKFGIGTLDGKIRDASAYVLPRDIQYSRYIEFIRPWVKAFGRERVHVLLFEALQNNPCSTMKALSNILGIDPTFYEHYSFPKKNETYLVSNQFVHSQALHLAKFLPRGKVKACLKQVYLWAQSEGRVHRKLPEDAVVLKALDSEFLPYNRQLARELRVNLSAWE